MAHKVGDTITLDGIDVYILAAKDENEIWSSDVGAEGVEYISVDKNHDLSYYFAGSDYVDEAEERSWVINTENKYGYEWGGWRVETGITSFVVGSGLFNTNSLIEMNLQPHTDGWYVVWDKIKEFRESHSDKWFLPNRNELDLIYEARSNLSGLTTINDSNKNPHYWSSTEESSELVWYQSFDDGTMYSDIDKFRHYIRSRLCRYITSSELYEKKTWVNDELITDVELNRIENRIKELHPFRVRDTVTLDNIDVYILAAKRGDGTWNSSIGATGVEYIGVDKNHDLSYYFTGNDYVDEVESTDHPGVINTANKYGYEWGGYGTTIGVTAEDIGTGLSNTNSLIAKNLQPNTDGWYVVWDKIKEFRQSHSDKWFLPSSDELDLIYEVRNNLSNLSSSEIFDSSVDPAYYWSSSELNSTKAWGEYSTDGFIGGQRGTTYKEAHDSRSRLCRYITSSDLYEKKVWVNDEIITSTELNRIENRIKELRPSYEPHEWVNDEIITADKLNAIEDALVDVKPKPIIYGFHINPNESDPYESVTYIGSAVGMTPAYMDYNTGTFNYGSWEDAFFMPKPCMLKYDGTVDYYLNPNDYTKKEDGTESDISNTAYEGNAMMEWGRNGNKIWWKIIPTDDGLGADIYISEYQLDDGYHAYSFIREDGTYTDHFYTPIYSGSLIEGKLRSISGQTNLASKNATTEITYATANGEGWYTETWCDRILINILLTLISKNLNVQSAFGNGNINYIASNPEQNYGVITTGTMNDKGMFWGSNTSSTSTGVKVFGMENYWANQWRRVAGFMQRSGEALLKMTPPYNTTGDNYETMEGLSQASGCIRNFKFDGTLGFIPSVVGGSTSTYYSDYYYISPSVTCYLVVGGYVNVGLACGPWFLDLSNSASYAYWLIGVAPSYR